MKATETQTKNVEKALTFDLTKDEVNARLETILGMEETVEGELAEIKATRDTARARIKDILKERRTLRTQIRTGRETRTVKCKEVFNFKEGTVTTVFSGKTFETRDMADHERQEPIFKKTKVTKTVRRAKAPVVTLAEARA